MPARGFCFKVKCLRELLVFDSAMERFKSDVVVRPDADYDDGLHEDTMGEFLFGAYLYPPSKADDAKGQQPLQESTSCSSLSSSPRQQQLLDDFKEASPPATPSAEHVDSVAVVADADASARGRAEPVMQLPGPRRRLPSAGNRVWGLRARCCFSGLVCSRCRWRRLTPGSTLPSALRKAHRGPSRFQLRRGALGPRALRMPHRHED